MDGINKILTMKEVKMKKSYLIMVGLLLCVTLVWAGGKQEEVKETGPIDLNLLAWSYSVETVASNLDKFENDNPGIYVNYSDVSWFNFHDVMATRFVSKTPTDVVYNTDEFLEEWDSAGWIVPLEDHFPEATEYKKYFPQYVTDAVSYNGKLYGLPYFADIFIFIYNEDMVKEAGFDAPPTTWEEVTQQSVVMKQKGICNYPVAMQFAQKEGWSIMTVTSMVYSLKNGSLFDNDLNPVFAKSGSAAERIVTWIRDSLQDTKIMDLNSLQMAEIDVVKAMATGKHAFTILVKYNLAELNNPAASNLAGKFKMSLMPGETHETVGTARFYSLTKTAVDRGPAVMNAAWKLIEFLGGITDGEAYVVRRWVLEKGLGVSYLTMYDDPEVTAAIEKWGDVELEREQALLARIKEGMTPFYPAWDVFTRAELHKAFLDQITPQEALKASANKWNELKKAYYKE
jgi:multiple sugar transport system substrate-binding protein